MWCNEIRIMFMVLVIFRFFFQWWIYGYSTGHFTLPDSKRKSKFKTGKQHAFLEAILRPMKSIWITPSNKQIPENVGDRASRCLQPLPPLKQKKVEITKTPIAPCHSIYFPYTKNPGHGFSKIFESLGFRFLWWFGSWVCLQCHIALWSTQNA